MTVVSGSAARGRPEVGLLPAVRHARRLQEHDVGLRDARVRARERFRQFAEAGARARALRVREEDERRPIGRRRRAWFRRASAGRRCRDARTVLVRPDHVQAANGAGQPAAVNRDYPERRLFGVQKADQWRSYASMVVSDAICKPIRRNWLKAYKYLLMWTCEVTTEDDFAQFCMTVSFIRHTDRD